jgi:hypothetical protein
MTYPQLTDARTKDELLPYLVAIILSPNTEPGRLKILNGKEVILEDLDEDLPKVVLKFYRVDLKSYGLRLVYRSNIPRELLSDGQMSYIAHLTNYYL